MGMVVQHNLNALSAYNKLNTNVAGLKKSSEKLASGYRINRAGDDAAGLAISEKMRSQIRGLNQAVRNSQDGINMIQTYEGAAQESHNILQRMKELASEAANGTYQNEVDRDAVQLEFNQLNDELNQIADTDFNGVVMLNGGQMADGTLQVNGKFDYAKGTAYAPTQLGKNNVNGLDSNVWDDATKANAAWAALNATWTRQEGQPATYGPDSVDITFKYDKSTSSWSAINANNGASIKEVTTSATKNGGFKVLINDAEVSNVVFDQDVVHNGDTITLRFNNPSDGIAPPSNAGAKVSDDTNFTEHDLALVDANNLTVLHGAVDPDKQTALTDAQDAVKAADGTGAQKDYDDAKAALAADADASKVDWSDPDYKTSTAYTGLNGAGKQLVDDFVTAKDALDTAIAAVDAAKADLYSSVLAPSAADMTEDVNELYNQLNGAEFTASYTDKATVAGDFKIVLNNGTELKDTKGTAGTGTEFVIGDTTFLMKTDQTTGMVTISDEDGKVYMTIGASIQDAATDKTDADPANWVINSTGSISWKLGVDNNQYDAGAKPTVEVAATGSVSKANNNNAANAPLTYTDHIVLQTGAHTKDSVDFTMEYSTEGMGELKANLNISSRADGLNTANLSLNTQEDANHAIDRIDNAINKVSMVRATFGATQNRLEHKIDNLTTTSTNIQEAESGIRDTDMASEMMNYTKFNILQQAAQSMLAQANQQPQSILQLLG